MRGGHAQGAVCKATGYHGRAQNQTFRHGGTGAVQSQIGQTQSTGGKAGGDALVQQVAPKGAVDAGQGQVGLGQGGFAGQFHHPALGLLPGLFAKAVVPGHMVKAFAQRPLAFLGAYGGGPGLHMNGRFKKQGIAQSAHAITSISQRKMP